MSLLLATCVGISCSLPIFFFPNNHLNSLIYDELMRLRGVTRPYPGVVIVEIDEKSLKEFGQWPWPRHLLAELLEKLLAEGALAIGLDMLLAEPDRTSLHYVDKKLRERFATGLDLDKLPAEAYDNDAYFAEFIKDKPVVLGAYATYSHGEVPESWAKSKGIAEKTPPGAPPPRDTVPKTKGLLLPLKEFREAAPIGIINVAFDEDGIIRAVPLVIRAGDNLHASLSLRTLMLALKRQTMLLNSNRDGLANLRIGSIKIPVRADGIFHPVYRGPARTFPYLSAADVLSGNIAAGIKDKIVFVGASATGLLDQRATPFDHEMPGVEFHATLLDNIVTDTHIDIPHWEKDIQIYAIFIASFLATAVFSLFPLYVSAPLGICLIFIYFWGSWHFFEKAIFISPLYVILATLLMGGTIISLRFWREQRAKRQIRLAFSRYVAPEAVARIAEYGTRALEGEEREISILFTDVRDFTTISGKMQPGQVVRLLNSYFTPMTACVRARHGTLDKFIGDAMLAFWNAPLDVPDHQRQAVLAALEMQRKLAELRVDFQKNFNVNLRMGVGIHCGDARVGNMGSLDLLDYTCIGDNVNLASRLEGLCKIYGAEIIVSVDIRDKVKDINFRQLDRIMVKGSNRPLAIYTPVDGKWNEESESLWTTALKTYFDGKFLDAERLFANLERISQFGKAARLFRERCGLLVESQPGIWDGVFKYTTK